MRRWSPRVHRSSAGAVTYFPELRTLKVSRARIVCTARASFALVKTTYQPSPNASARCADSSRCLCAAPRRPRWARRRARARAPAARGARRTRGWLSPPHLSRDIARRGAAVFFCHFLFSRPVAGLRPRLASSLRSPRPAERGRGARGAKGDARGARTSRVALAAAAQPGHRAPRWSSPPGPLLSSSRPSLRARAAPSLHPRAGGARAHHERARERAPSATRRAQRAGSPSAARPRSSRPAVSRAGRVCFWALLL